MSVIHMQTGSSSVRCGARMGADWDLGNVTVDPTKVTCPSCRHNPVKVFGIDRPYRSRTAQYRAGADA